VAAGWAAPVAAGSGSAEVEEVAGGGWAGMAVLGWAAVEGWGSSEAAGAGSGSAEVEELAGWAAG
jgi:hypothetical protein